MVIKFNIGVNSGEGVLTVKAHECNFQGCWNILCIDLGADYIYLKIHEDLCILLL